MGRHAVRNIFVHDIGHFSSIRILYKRNLLYWTNEAPSNSPKHITQCKYCGVLCGTDLGLLIPANSRKIKAVAITFDISHCVHVIQTVSFLKSTSRQIKKYEVTWRMVVIQ